MKEDTLFTIDCGEFYLREFCEEDVDAIVDITSQHEVAEYLPDWKSTREQRLDWVMNYEIPENQEFLAAVPKLRHEIIRLGIILKESNEFIGFCTSGIKKELGSSCREVAYAISKHHQNKGYATKAVKRLIHYLFQHTNVEILHAVVLPRNGSSNKVIQKCGFRLNEMAEIDGEQFNHYVLMKEDWN
ncbi:GNAT family N-acetyltransferase [Lysinibacillus odysseyi]|uniref:Acetyltransferase n=1 Tax=Lysinibacillus odysseyi 34hs-1 = NBRC 100172 TaxID=1220589 RepID=A0A0A3JBI8_9BACI|nr:GNAT family N-acetyltransferase [Lysinibacillus odysseyi]KGR84382.1 acetyltransferase [Lysinibacillus odysseyi 34hs-1 = NBRC 100172]